MLLINFVKEISMSITNYINISIMIYYYFNKCFFYKFFFDDFGIYSIAI